MPLVLAATIAYAAGLLVGFGGALVPALAAAGLLLALGILRDDGRASALALVAVAGMLSAALAGRNERRCARVIAEARVWEVALEDAARPGAAARGSLRAPGCATHALLLVRQGRAPAGAVVRVTGRLQPGGRGMMVQQAVVSHTGRRARAASMRAAARARIDRLFGADAPLVRALLVADTREIPGETRDRFAASGLVHVLSISGLHVAIVAGAVQLLLAAARLRRRDAALLAVALTAAYVLLLGAPPPATRAGVMLAVRELGALAQRNVSPWAALALGALVPLAADARAVLDLGWQLSVAGMASLVAAGVLVRRHLTPRLEGWRLRAASELATGTVATLATAPLVAHAFGSVSLMGPLSNIAAAPVVALLQPTLFLALVLSPLEPVARLAADAAHPMLLALDRVAAAFAIVPGAAPSVAPSTTTALMLAGASAALLSACAAHFPARALAAAALLVAAAAWHRVLPRAGGRVELHMIDVGQGDALALRTPRGRWILFDAGRAWRGGDAGRTTVVPYLRRRGGALAAFVLSHPHADHVGGAASVIRALRPLEYRDAAFAGPGDAYRGSLATADSLGVRWDRVRPGDSLAVDGVVVRFLAPDSAWTASLRDPNLASTIALVRFGLVRFLLVGDAERPQEAWLLRYQREWLAADVLKVGHHGSATSSGDEFLDAVRPRVALVPVGIGNTYGHPSADVMARLARRGAAVLRSDELGTVIVRTDGRQLTIEAYGVEWPVSSDSRRP